MYVWRGAATCAAKAPRPQDTIVYDPFYEDMPRFFQVTFKEARWRSCRLLYWAAPAVPLEPACPMCRSCWRASTPPPGWSLSVLRSARRSCLPRCAQRCAVPRPAPSCGKSHAPIARCWAGGAGQQQGQPSRPPAAALPSMTGLPRARPQFFKDGREFDGPALVDHMVSGEPSSGSWILIPPT